MVEKQGVLSNLIKNKDQLLKVEKNTLKGSKGSFKAANRETSDEILTDDSEVERLSKYIAEKFKNKILNVYMAIKYGVEKIGTKGDTNQVLKKLLGSASAKTKRYAAKILVEKWAKENLTNKLKSKSGKEIIGKMVSKNIYIKKVSVTYKKGKKAGQTINYLQARSLLTGRVVKMKTAVRLLGKVAKKG